LHSQIVGMTKWILLTVVSCCLNASAFSQQQDTLSGNGAITVFTATKTERLLSNIAVPVQIISQKTIQQAGSLRLSDILS